jgi:hypothetical protein
MRSLAGPRRFACVGEHVMQLIAADRDRSGDIADAWLNDVRRQFDLPGGDLRA